MHDLGLIDDSLLECGSLNERVVCCRCVVYVGLSKPFSSSIIRISVGSIG